MRDKYGIEAKIWHRWSDNCANQVRMIIWIYNYNYNSYCSQFKSCYVMEKLRTSGKDMGMPEDAIVHWHTFESGEGKNESMFRYRYRYILTPRIRDSYSSSCCSS